MVIQMSLPNLKCKLLFLNAFYYIYHIYYCYRYLMKNKCKKIHDQTKDGDH